MRKIFLVILVLISLALVGFNTGAKQENQLLKSPTPTIKRDVIFDVPQRLIIKSINVDSKVESVGMDKEGRMDVPKLVEDVAWYNLGPKPGAKGSAVIAGHLDTVTGSPAVFYDLSKLKKGDEIEVYDKNERKLIFKVSKIQAYDSNNFPLKEVFADDSEKRLNLITCNGTWDSQNKNYSKRLVVFSVLKD